MPYKGIKFHIHVNKLMYSPSSDNCQTKYQNVLDCIIHTYFDFINKFVLCIK